jgi:hypothetical protein
VPKNSVKTALPTPCNEPAIARSFDFLARFTKDKARFLGAFEDRGVSGLRTFAAPPLCETASSRNLQNWSK